ncbi:MAG: serpin family protein, partial [Calditrichaeota bacterium]
MNKFCLIVPGLVLLAWTACSRDMSYQPQTVQVRSLTAGEKAINHSSTDFGFDLLAELEQDNQENLFISPLSISMALAMTLNGASGETAAEMIKTLHHTTMSEEERNSAYQSLIALLTSIDRQIQFEIANSIWIRQDFQVEPDFVNLNQKYFDAMVQNMDFASPSAVQQINEWVSRNTHEKIKKILDSIPGDMVMYLMNAIYFKGDWSYQFDKEKTSDRSFKPTPTSAIPCRMMIQTNDAFPYYADEKAQVIDLPYGNGQFSTTVFLPAEGFTTTDILRELTPEKWQQTLQMLQKQRGTLELPKFKLEYEKILNQTLMDLGMQLPFSVAADFTRINKNGNLYISEVKHKTFVQVDEEGTEAAAVTSVGISLTSIGGDKAGFFMTVDRPFVMIIHEKSSGALLFMGVIRQPRWE